MTTTVHRFQYNPDGRQRLLYEIDAGLDVAHLVWFGSQSTACARHLVGGPGYGGLPEALRQRMRPTADSVDCDRCAAAIKRLDAQPVDNRGRQR